MFHFILDYLSTCIHFCEIFLYFKQYFYRSCVIDHTTSAWSARVELIIRFNHTSCVTAVTPTGRPTLVQNRCVIEVFGGVFYVVTLLFGCFCEFRGFCHRTESDLFLILFYSKGIPSLVTFK